MNTPGKTFTFRVEEGLREDLQSMAKRLDRSVGWLVREALKAYIEKYKGVYGSVDKK